jgi:hypothetical protein
MAWSTNGTIWPCSERAIRWKTDWGWRQLSAFLSEDKARFRHASTEVGLNEARVRFDFEGTKVIM